MANFFISRKGCLENEIIRMNVVLPSGVIYTVCHNFSSFFMGILHIFYYYFPHIREYGLSFFGTFFVYGVGIFLADTVSPLFIRDIVNALSSGVARADQYEQAFQAIVWFAVITFLYEVCFRIGDYAMAWSQSGVLRKLSEFSLEKLVRHSYSFFSNTLSGSLITQSKRFVHSFEVIHDVVMFNIWFAVVTVTGTFFVLFMISPLLGWCMTVWIAVYLGVAVTLSGKQRVYDDVTAKADSKMIGFFSDVIVNMLNVKIFSSAEREKKLFSQKTGEFLRMKRRAAYFYNIVWAWQGFAMFIVKVAGLFLLLYLWKEEKITVGDIALVQLYFLGVLFHLWNIGRSLTRMSQAATDAREMIEIFEKKPDVLDPEVPEVCGMRSGDIVFSDISFSYGNKNRSVFRNFSLHIHSGEKVGLVGLSGSGKTTLTKILLRFKDVQSGAVLIDGQNIRCVRQDDLRRRISYVPQDPILFHRTLKENIAYGKFEATQEEIVHAAKLAHAHEFIGRFTQGYDTLVGERGVKLSGGERQRIALARAILENAPILILDEATSSLDSESESLIQDALSVLLEKKTAIVIAHRLSTIRRMDRIIVLGKGGQILEEGKHDELLERRGAYFSLWSYQAEGMMRE